MRQPFCAHGGSEMTRTKRLQIPKSKESNRDEFSGRTGLRRDMFPCALSLRLHLQCTYEAKALKKGLAKYLKYGGHGRIRTCDNAVMSGGF